MYTDIKSKNHKNTYHYKLEKMETPQIQRAPWTMADAFAILGGLFLQIIIWPALRIGLWVNNLFSPVHRSLEAPLLFSQSNVKLLPENRDNSALPLQKG